MRYDGTVQQAAPGEQPSSFSSGGVQSSGSTNAPSSGKPPGPATGRRDLTANTDALLQAPDSEALGRHAGVPTQIPWRGWKRVLGRTFREIISDRLSLVSAGCAFYATLALFPAISMLVSIYGLAFDPVTVEPQLGALRGLLPPAAFTLISDRVHTLVSQPRSALTVGLLISVGITLWSSATGVKSLLSALNMAYEETETRSFVRFQATALSMTLAAIIAAVVGIATLVALPAAMSFLGISEGQKMLARLASLGVLLVFVIGALSLLYRFGPSRRSARWQWITPGSLLATALWLIASAVFSYYVGHFASYDATYGPLGAVIGMMLWFWVTAYVVLAGAELNAELELQTSRDTTDGPMKPIGARGAYVADHVAR